MSEYKGFNIPKPVDKAKWVITMRMGAQCAARSCEVACDQCLFYSENRRNREAFLEWEEGQKEDSK